MALSNREIQVLELISLEYTYREIAHALYVSYNTVLSHRKNIKLKLGVKNGAGLVREGFSRGYLDVRSN